MIDEGLKVAVAEQQRDLVFDASRGDDGIDRLANRDAFGAKQPEIAGRLNRYVAPHHIQAFKRAEHQLRFVEVALVRKTLEHLGEDEISDRHGFATGEIVQPIGFPGRGASEIIDPDARIDEDQASDRIASRSPDQFNWPRNCRISLCSRS